MKLLRKEAIAVTTGVVLVGAVWASLRLRNDVAKRMEARALARAHLSPVDDLAERLVGADGETQLQWLGDTVQAAKGECGPHVNMSVESTHSIQTTEVVKHQPVVESTNMLSTNEITYSSPVRLDMNAHNDKGRIEYDASRREVAAHYVITDKKRYMTVLIQTTKARFGCPERTQANLLAVRKFMLDQMIRHKVRPTHQAQVLPLAVELVFVQSDSEREALKIGIIARGAQTGVISWIINCWETMFGSANLDVLSELA